MAKSKRKCHRWYKLHNSCLVITFFKAHRKRRHISFTDDWLFFISLKDFMVCGTYYLPYRFPWLSSKDKMCLLRLSSQLMYCQRWDRALQRCVCVSKGLKERDKVRAWVAGVFGVHSHSTPEFHFPLSSLVFSSSSPSPFCPRAALKVQRGDCR